MNLHIILLILHVLGAGVMIGIGVLAFLAAVHPPLTEKHLDRMGFVGHYGMWASLWQLLTGIALMANEWSEHSHNPLIWTKIVLWAVEGTISSMVIGRQVKRVRAALTANQPPPSAGLITTLLVNTMIILAIAAIGVFVVSGKG